MEKIISSNFGDISKKDTKRIERRAGRARTGDYPALNIYIGTCPDYSHDGQNYTFDGVGGGVPLLTKLQLQANSALFEQLELFWHTVRMPHAFSGHRSAR